MGSVAAGGRYDNLVGMFSGKQQIPCVGISFGVERIFSITKQRLASSTSLQPRLSAADVYVMAFGGKGFTGMWAERQAVVKKLWDADINAELQLKIKPKLPQQFKAAETLGVPFVVILGEEEQAKGMCKVKEMGLPEGHPEKDGVEVELERLAEEVQRRLEKWRTEKNVVNGLQALGMQ